jgi:DNA-binding transcriptional ArsR family regulator
VLRKDGLVTTRRESQTIFYRVTTGPALDLIRVLHGHFCSATP